MGRVCRRAALLAVCCIAASSAQGGLNIRKRAAVNTPAAAPPVSRLIGYFDANSQKDLQAANVPHSNLTHVVLLNALKVDNTGKIRGRGKHHPWEHASADLIQSLAAESTRLIVGLRGYPDDVALDELTESGRAPKFAEEIADTISQWGADGIEVEWHSDDVEGGKALDAPFDTFEEQHMELFASALGRELHRRKKTLSFAVRPKRKEFRTGEFVRDNLDWLSLRAFSMRTLGDPHHSSMKDAREALAEWTERGVPRSQLVLDVPLFARPGAALRKGRDEHLRRPWHEIAGDPGHKAHPLSYGAAGGDIRGDVFVDQATGKAWFASGINTTMAKTRLVLADGYGGVGFRELHHDAAAHDLSLVQAAAKAVKQHDDEVAEAARRQQEANGQAWVSGGELGLFQRWLTPHKSKGGIVDIRDEF